jgi:signal transduction histidine kinase
MSRVADTAGQAGLQYFGRASASISHELKNALAIIGENAGLMNDYLHMAERNVPLDPTRLKTVTSRIESQIQRADGIIKNMNRLAHSVDDPVKSVDLQEIVDLFVKVSQREAAMRRVSLSIIPSAAAATVTTAPFLLLTLLGRCLSHALDAATPGQTLTLQITRSDDGGRINFEPLTGLSGLPAGSFPRESENALLAALKATLDADGAAGRLIITLSNC